VSGRRRIRGGALGHWVLPLEGAASLGGAAHLDGVLPRRLRSLVDALAGRGELWHLGTRPPEAGSSHPHAHEPDWVQASPMRIERALRHALGKRSGGWYVLGAAREITRTPVGYTVLGQELVAWRGREGRLRVAPAACPHMGADLSCGRVAGDELVCPWHGLRLGETPHGRWRPLPSWDDGVLAWVRLDPPGGLGRAENEADPPTEAPILPERPARFLDGVVRVDAICEPRDVLANRLDPWHGAWFHPHSFARLRVLEETVEAITVRVSYRVLGPVAVEVDARFHCPDPRTIVMTIVRGEGRGSVVETHATPLGVGTDGRPRTAIIEATLATSERAGFARALAARHVLRPFIEARARRLWVEDAAYAERAYALRARAAAACKVGGVGMDEEAGAGHCEEPSAHDAEGTSAATVAGISAASDVPS
jgi:isorenieratene synthase